MKSHGFNSERSEESTAEPQLQLRAKRGVNRRAAASTPSEARSQPWSRSFNSERSKESTDEPQLQLRAKRGVNRGAGKLFLAAPRLIPRYARNEKPWLQLRAKRGVNRRAAASTPSEARSQPKSRSFNSERSEESTEEPPLQIQVN